MKKTKGKGLRNFLTEHYFEPFFVLQKHAKKDSSATFLSAQNDKRACYFMRSHCLFECSVAKGRIYIGYWGSVQKSVSE